MLCLHEHLNLNLFVVCGACSILYVICLSILYKYFIRFSDSHNTLPTSTAYYLDVIKAENVHTC